MFQAYPNPDEPELKIEYLWMSLPAIVAIGYYGGVGSLCPF